MKAAPAPGSLAEVLRLVGEALRDLRFGQIVIQVHDGSVVQRNSRPTASRSVWRSAPATSSSVSTRS